MHKLFLITLITILYTTVVHAAGDGAVPIQTVISQIANIVLLVLLIGFSQRKTIAKAFADKKQGYLDQLQAASLSKKQAEDLLEEVSQRLHEIKTTYDEQITKAKTQAELAYKEQLVKAAQDAERIEKMALMSLEYEKQKEVERLRLEAFEKSATLAENQLSDQFSPELQKAWTHHFSLASQGAH